MLFLKSNKFFLFIIAGFTLILFSCAHAPTAQVPLTAKEHRELGEIYEAKGEMDNALKQYRAAIEADKSRPEAYFAYANLNLKMARYEAAKKAYQRAIARDKKNGIYHNNLGWLYMQTGKYKKAQKQAQLALALDPARGFIYYDTLGVIYTRQKKYAAAQKSLVAAASAVPVKKRAALLKIYTHMLELHKASGDYDAEVQTQHLLEKLK